MLNQIIRLLLNCTPSSLPHTVSILISMRQSMKLYTFNLVLLLLFFLYIRSLCFDMETDGIDLGFNEDYLDHCDYFDYSTLTNDTKATNTLTVVQLNTRG